MFLTNDIRYIGVNDHTIDLFESQYPAPNGMAYNSYLILDEKIAVLDTVDRNFGAEWMENLQTALGDRKPDYLIVQHMEPDHSACIGLFLDRYPEAKVVASGKGAATSRTLSASEISDAASGGKLACGVRCTTANGGTVDSGVTAIITVASAPALVIGPATLTAQPMSIPVESTLPNVRVALTVTAMGGDGARPDGGGGQAGGDTVHAREYTPALSAVTWGSSLEKSLLQAQLASANAAKAAATAELAGLSEGDDGYDGG